MSAAPAPSEAIRLDVVSDVVCPWCYIGKHRLEQGLALLDGELAIEVRWRPFELNPGLPPAGMERRAYCEAKFGSLERAAELYENVAANARADGLPIDIGRIARTPNTRRAHALIERAGDAGCQDAMVDALFAAYFVDGRDVGDPATLGELALGVGLDARTIDAALNDHGVDAEIAAAVDAAHERGVTGVPAFLWNGRLLFAGAQSAETIALSFRRAANKGL